jgi:hypothetical protein
VLAGRVVGDALLGAERSTRREPDAEEIGPSGAELVPRDRESSPPAAPTMRSSMLSSLPT